MSEQEHTFEARPPYYFGCHHDLGHYWWSSSMQRLRVPYGRTPGTPWGHVDGQLTPSHTPGDAALHHRDGWTALAFEDTSVDHRPASNSVFLFDEVLDFDAAVAKARSTFPQVWDRFDFEVTEHAA